ncbi:Ig-like domain-containing protein [Neobacillus drentensis]|uniref:Ig-like domain-containing protein n=1 Tax=Neobacillus drentensis TaxID=220684 RepID=UPI003000F8C7
MSSKKTVKALDRTAPKIPAINKITSKTKYIKGKAEKKATVYVFNKSQKVGKAKVDNKGNFNVKIKAQKKKSQLKIYVIDGAGNKSKIKVIRVY